MTGKVSDATGAEGSSVQIGKATHHFNGGAIVGFTATGVEPEFDGSVMKDRAQYRSRGAQRWQLRKHATGKPHQPGMICARCIRAIVRQPRQDH